MGSKLLQTRFYLPEASPQVKNKRALIGSIMKEMRKDGGIKYAGYLKESELQKDLSRHIGAHSLSRYQPLSVRRKGIISKDIRSAARKCHRVLPHPDPPVFVFVYPWFPNSKENARFEGISALAAYYTIHLFINPDSYTKLSLQKTIAHEWNHLVFYRYNPKPRYALGGHILMEGLAEVFREEVMGGKPAPWASALTRNQAREQLARLGPKLASKDVRTYNQVFFGDKKKYRRWTGYSIGYRLVKEFRRNHSKLAWSEIIKLKSENILAKT